MYCLNLTETHEQRALCFSTAGTTSHSNLEARQLPFCFDYLNSHCRFLPFILVFII